MRIGIPDDRLYDDRQRHGARRLRMCPPAGAALALVFAAALSAAQSPNPHDGQWTVRFNDPKRIDISGTVVIQGSEGTWKTLAQSRVDACVGIESPLVVKQASAEEIEFEVQRSKALRGCNDFTLKLRKSDDRTLAGHFRDGRPVVLTRDK